MWKGLFISPYPIRRFGTEIFGKYYDTGEILLNGVNKAFGAKKSVVLGEFSVALGLEDESLVDTIIRIVGERLETFQSIAIYVKHPKLELIEPIADTGLQNVAWVLGKPSGEAFARLVTAGLSGDKIMTVNGDPSKIMGQLVSGWQRWGSLEFPEADREILPIPTSNK